MSARHEVRRALVVLGCALVAAGALPGCGQPAPSGAAWRGSHPDPAGYSFLEQGQLGGLCAISVHYPDEAPSAIVRGGSLYLQRGRSALSTERRDSPRVVGRSGDWTLLDVPAGALTLTTASNSFQYQPKSSC